MSTNSAQLHILTEPLKCTCNAFQNTVAQTMINVPALLFGMCQTAAAVHKHNPISKYSCHLLSFVQ